MIVQLARGRFALVSRTGHVLGTHTSRAAAEAQEVAITISKARRAGHRIPRVNKSATARAAPRRHRRRRSSGGR